MKNLLFAWLGTADYEACKNDYSKEEGLGPIAQAITERSFNQVRILISKGKIHYESSTKWPDVSIPYKKWLQKQTDAKIKLIQTNLLDPTELNEIHHCAKRALDDAVKEFGGQVNFTFHLSPGTQFMAHVWIFLKSRYNAKLIKSHFDTKQNQCRRINC